MKPISFFAAGVVVGALVTGALSWQMNAKTFERQYLISAPEQASLAVELQSGKQEAVLKRVAPRLPEYALTIDRLYIDNPLSQQPLWMIKTFYERGQRPVSQEIDSILQALPPKPPTSS